MIMRRIGYKTWQMSDYEVYWGCAEDIQSYSYIKMFRVELPWDVNGAIRDFDEIVPSVNIYSKCLDVRV